jgi:TatA/E family protein of Tat protein translocase
MFGIGTQELLLILILALLIIGPKKLPDLARTLGKAFGDFQKATRELKEEIDIVSDIKDAPPSKTTASNTTQEDNTKDKLNANEEKPSDLDDSSKDQYNPDEMEG